MATGDLGVDPEAALRAERDALAARCERAEAEVERLRAELAAAQDSSLSLFEGPDAGPFGDGTDPRVLSLLLGITAGVAGMVALLTLLNGSLLSPFGLLVLAIAVGLAWGAARTRVVPVEVEVVRGLVYITRGDDTHRFDLRKPTTQVEVVGRPGEAGWAVRFPRRNLDPFVVDASMVDPARFLEQLREHRPEL